MTERPRTRREVVAGWLATATFGLGAVGVGVARPAQAQLAPTPSCGAPEPATVAQTEGPFFRPRTPAKRDFRADAPGEPISLIGFVVDTGCRPIADARVELWHADARGAYDEAGFRLRGHQRTDAEGRYAFDTIVPGTYPGRTRHFHVKVERPGGRALTTQLYFPGERGNRRDGIYDARLVMRVDKVRDGQVGRFDFLLRAG